MFAFGAIVVSSRAFLIPPTTPNINNSSPLCPRAKLFMSERSIHDLIEELVSKQIPFSTTASLDELESLLTHHEEKRKYNENEDYAYNSVQVKPMVNRGPSKRRQRRQQNAVDIWDDNISEGTSAVQSGRRRRQQKRQLLGRSISSSQDTVRRIVDKTSRVVESALPGRVVDLGGKVTRVAGRRSKRMLDKLLEYTFEDDDAETPSKDTKQAVVDLRQEIQHEPVARDSTTRQPQWVRDRKDRRNGRDSRSKILKERPLREILSLLKENDIVFPPTATRDELEGLLRNILSTEVPEEKIYNVKDGVVSKDGAGPGKRTSKQQKYVESAKNESRKAYRRGASMGNTPLFQDDPKKEMGRSNPIIVDAIVETVVKENEKKEDVSDVNPITTERKSRRTIPRQNQSSRLRREQRMKRPARENDSIRYFQNQSLSLNDFDPYLLCDEVSPQSKYLLPPFSSATGKTQHRWRQVQYSRPSRRSDSGGRKVYSPYRKDDIYLDGLDRFGNFFANTVDSLLWVEKDEETETSKKPGTHRARRGRMDRSSETRSRRRSGHWKDRMEEQFDYLMGIHKDGRYYNRWVEKGLEDEASEEGTDAVSYARGRSPGVNGNRRKRVSKQPIWEEEGSLLSSLFGLDESASRRNDLFYRSDTFLGQGSVVKILRTLFRSCALIASGVCRWASVRGSVPQPVVVVGAISSLLCSRPGVRIRNLVVALVAIRAVGELFHEYAYDDDDFWDHDDEETDKS